MGNGQTTARDRDDGHSVEILSRRYYAVLQRYFARRDVDSADAPDLVQEVFARLSHRGALDKIANVDGYLFATAANIAMDHFRRRKVRSNHLGRARRDELSEAQEFGPDRLAEGRQELSLIVDALNEMPERMRNIFILARLENMPRAEIAVRLGISKRLVEQQITLATACLADRRRRLA
jgi:RNA polymerase sigma-70 factor (ECF subfamily)